LTSPRFLQLERPSDVDHTFVVVCREEENREG
jgi:hypothetical protein